MAENRDFLLILGSKPFLKRWIPLDVNFVQNYLFGVDSPSVLLYTG